VIWAGGSAQTIPFHSLSLLDAIKGSAGQSTKVEYIPACTSFNPTGELAFSYQGIFEPIDGGDRGLRADYFENDNLEGPPKASRIDAYPTDWHGDNDGPEEIKTQNYSVRWTGKLVAPQTDSYVLAINATSTRVMLDGKIILDTWFNTANGAEKQSVVIGMQKNEKHEIVIEHRKNSKNYSIQFTWGKAKPALTGEEKELIRNADAVIYAAGFNPHLESEGVDRSYELPGDQSEELRRLGTLNKRVIAVMNAGGNFGMQNWIDYVPGLICAWYPGQNGNQAVAEILFGDLNPSGHLPDTFEKRWEDSPAYGNYPGDRKNGGTVKYEEAIYSGYRWYDKKNISPRFPFGYGLSYTTFSVQNLSTVSTQGINVNNGRDSTITVTADVTNTGKRKGDCVVQLYVRPMDESIDRPVQELKGFSRVSLEPNQSKKITLQLNRDAFGTYDEHKHNWIHPAGRYEIALGLSSREIQASKTVSFAGDTSH
jgi:beta-glucosidase